jgi:beta-glucosidase
MAVARELAEEAITLLKNDGGLLPLKADKLKSLAVIGPNAEGMVVSGGGSSRVTPPQKVTPLDALRAKLSGKTEVVYEQGCSNREEAPHYAESIRKAAELAKSSSAAIVFVGMPEFFETEGQDRPHMHLPGDQDQLVREVLQANPRTIVVLNCGAPVEMPWVDSVPAIVQMYYPGMQGGEAIARVLLGEVNPSGKLPVTYPRRLEDTPAYINYPGGREVYYGERIYVGYRYYQTKGVQPLFPFGHGLSYTHFDYKRLRVPERAKIGETVRFTVQVANLGKLNGKETVQVYVHDAASSLDRPESELKAFQKVALEAGESTKLEFALDERAFAFYDSLQEKWVVEPGEFQIRVGSSSEDIRCTAKLILE